MSIVFADREAAYPNKYKVIPEDGSEEYYVVLERADEPLTPGTPLNAETFNNMVDDYEKRDKEHADNKNNPHGVTAEQVGLGNVPNVITDEQTPSHEEPEALTELSSGEKLRVAMGKIACAVRELISHLGDKENPHGVTAAQVGAFSKDELIPLANGGAGRDLSDIEPYSIIRAASNSAYLLSTPTANGAFYATATNGAAKFGTLPIAQGGTGATTATAALTALGAAPADSVGTNKVFKKLTDIGITTFPTTMSTVASKMPNNSTLILDSRDIVTTTTTTAPNEISDLGVAGAGTYMIMRGNTTSRVQLLHIYGSASGETSYVEVGNYAVTPNTVSWVRALDNATTKDYVTAQGKSGNWHYRKYNSGYCECWRTVGQTVAKTQWETWGGICLTPLVSVGALPFTVYGATPCVTAHNAGSTFALGVITKGDISSTTANNVQAFRGTAANEAINIVYNFYVVGRWKE